jgi:hypothetical protein
MGVPWYRNKVTNVGVSWYVGDNENSAHNFMAAVRPQYGICFDLTWTSYMNCYQGIKEYLNNSYKSKANAFSNSKDQFFGRANAKSWFMENKDGRKFETDIKKGELGDLIFMGEDNDMQGHSVLLAGEVVMDKNSFGNETITFTTLGTMAEVNDKGEWVFGEKVFIFMKYKKNGKYYWTSNDRSTRYEFKGFGQLSSKITDSKKKYEHKYFGISLGKIAVAFAKENAKAKKKTSSSDSTNN